MARIELALGIEQIRIDALVRQRAGGELSDELLRGPGQNAADMDVPLLQAPDQVERLVGRDAAADDQGDARLRRCGAADGPLPRSRRAGRAAAGRHEWRRRVVGWSGWPWSVLGRYDSNAIISSMHCNQYRTMA